MECRSHSLKSFRVYIPLSTKLFYDWVNRFEILLCLNRYGKKDAALSGKCQLVETGGAKIFTSGLWGENMGPSLAAHKIKKEQRTVLLRYIDAFRWGAYVMGACGILLHLTPMGVGGTEVNSLRRSETIKNKAAMPIWAYPPPPPFGVLDHYVFLKCVFLVCFSLLENHPTVFSPAMSTTTPSTTTTTTLPTPTTTALPPVDESGRQHKDRLSDLKIIDNLLKTYDRRATPTNKFGKPTQVGCELFIRSFGSISEKTMVRRQPELSRFGSISNLFNTADHTVCGRISATKIVFSVALAITFDQLNIE